LGANPLTVGLTADPGLFGPGSVSWRVDRETVLLAGGTCALLMQLAHPAVAAGVAWILAFWLRFNLDIPPEYQAHMLRLLPWEAGVYAVTFLGLGLYRGLWRFASLPDLRRILLAAGIGALAVPAAFALARGGLQVAGPRSREKTLTSASCTRSSASARSPESM
jgi:hypothetical protein